MRRISIPLVIHVFALLMFAGDGRAELIIDDAVFAHDFENILGNDITGLIGPTATKTASIAADTTDPISLFSTRHVQAPNGSAFATIDTNVKLTSSIPAMSFSIFYNDRGDNGHDTGASTGQARLLSSFVGTGSPPDATAFGTLQVSGTEREFRFYGGNTAVSSDALTPTQDAQWHQAGFVFQDGFVTFYFDGSQLGSTRPVPGVAAIPVQGLDWFLIEDATSASVSDEYFDDGDYDEAALWYRALSAEEMSALYSRGLNAPEPSTLALLCMGAVAIGRRRRKR